MNGQDLEFVLKKRVSQLLFGFLLPGGLRGFGCNITAEHFYNTQLLCSTIGPCLSSRGPAATTAKEWLLWAASCIMHRSHWVCALRQRTHTLELRSKRPLPFIKPALLPPLQTYRFQPASGQETIIYFISSMAQGLGLLRPSHHLATHQCLDSIFVDEWRRADPGLLRPLCIYTITMFI